MTNQEAYEEAAGMGLEDIFFTFNGIDPDAKFIETDPILKKDYPNKSE